MSCGGGGGKGSNSASLGPVYIWVSTTSGSGNIGGLSGANTRCQNDATTAGAAAFNTAVTTHKAAIYTSTNDPSVYYSLGGRPLERPDGTAIANSYADFWDSTVTTSATVTKIGTTATNVIWLGNTTDNCSNWNSAAGFAIVGSSGTTNSDRIGAATLNCSFSYHIYCISY